MIIKTLTFRAEDDDVDVYVVLSTVTPDDEVMPPEGAVVMYVSDVDKAGLCFTLEEVKAMHKFFGDIIYDQPEDF